MPERALGAALPLFQEWTRGRTVSSIGTNNGAEAIAFQQWHKFKEAFPPELIQWAVTHENGEVQNCLDPFGGSGTTALASQFLGIASTTVEVNPFLADVIRVKLDRLDADQLAHSLGKICQRSRRIVIDPHSYFRHLPPTFIEPGQSRRWIFHERVAARIASLLVATDELQDVAHRRFYRVMLGGALIPLSNVTVNGKGRRYRQGWQNRRIDPIDVDQLFTTKSREAIADVHRFACRPRVRASVILGDARRFRTTRMHDLAVFSPPYPNSFDYTDVYNVELWTLGYLKSPDANRHLRHATLSSHVQLLRKYRPAPPGSNSLDATLSALAEIQSELWSPWIPRMVGAYFSELAAVFGRVHKAMREKASCWVVVGDSKYGGIVVRTGRILAELLPSLGWTVEAADPFRSMRSSSQHGGTDELAETLLMLRRR